MLFSDLENLPMNNFNNWPSSRCSIVNCGCEESTSAIDLEKVTEKIPETPFCVIKQFYGDHGKNYDFQNLYGNIDISRLRWTLISLEAKKICEASFYQDFLEWFHQVQNMFATNNFPLRGWEQNKSIWKDNGTWKTPPIFFGSSVKISINRSGLHLVEGHTRVASLKGLIERGVVSAKSGHLIWIGEVYQ